MNINKYTEKAQEAIVAAQQLADREGHPEMVPEHLLLTLVEQKEGIVPEIARKMNADPAALAAAVRGLLEKLPRARGGSQPTLSARLRKVTGDAVYAKNYQEFGAFFSAGGVNPIRFGVTYVNGSRGLRGFTVNTGVVF